MDDYFALAGGAVGWLRMWLKWTRRLLQGLKAPFSRNVERRKAEALGYLEAGTKTTAGVTAKAKAKATATTKGKQQQQKANSRSSAFGEG